MTACTRPASRLAVISVALLLGCAGPVDKGRQAMQAGQWGVATRYFEEAVAEHPEKVDALVGLGISRYRLGDHAEAADALSRAVALEPNHREARLYLGLTSLLRREDGSAEEQLTAFRNLAQNPALAVQVDRALRLLRGDPLADEIRQFIAASLENEAGMARQLQDAAQAAARTIPIPIQSLTRCTPFRHGRMLCF